MSLKEVEREVVKYTDEAQETNNWKAVVIMARKLCFSQNKGILLTG
jgi:hypothetical protein